MLNVSIVIYTHTPAEIAPLVETLRKSEVVSAIFLVDNSPAKQPEFNELDATYIFNNRNLGYGVAHNIAIKQTVNKSIPYHLVLNPDIAFGSEILHEIANYMNNNPKVGLLMPKILYPTGEIQYLCKLIPTPFDLIFRRFLPESWTRRRRARFEMRDAGYDHIMDVPYLSGCFMFLRTDAIRRVGMFDRQFFMYPEDIDLSRRIHRKFRTVYYPNVQVVHNHAQESYTNSRLLFVHIVNMIKYFNKWGWIFDKERSRINKKTLQQFK